MRLLSFSAAVTLAACNAGQPRIYRVALDDSSTKSIQQTECWKGGKVPTTSSSDTNLLIEEQWVVWDGADPDGSPKQFLDLGPQSYKLGDSPQIDFDDTIGSTTPGSFLGAHVRSDTISIPGAGSYIEVRETSITTSFSDLGA